jgi:hypothetical protein
MSEEAMQAEAPLVMSVPRRLARSFAFAGLGEPVLTAAFWGSIALYVAAMWVPKFPPLVDYPQHLGIASLLQGWLAGGATERALYDVNLFTYNASFHTLVALLGFVVPVETAGRIVLSLVPPLFGLGALSLMRAARRPRWYALLALPLVYNSVFTWGFVNNSLGYAVALTVFAWHYRAQEASAAPGGETRGLWARAVLGGLLVAYLHICATFFLCAAAGLVALHRCAHSGAPPKVRFGSLLRACLALLPPALLSGAFVVFNATSAHANWENGMHDGLDEYAWRKVVHFADLVFGNFADGSDRRLFWMFLLALGALYWPRRQKTPAGRDFRMLLAFFLLLYLIVPRVLFATWFMFERFGVIVALMAIAAAPVVKMGRASFFKMLVAALAIVTPANVVRQVASVPDEADADAVLEAIPRDAKVQGLIWEPSPWPVLERQTWVHFQSYAMPRRHAETMPSFTFIESMPVHYKLDRRPPRPPAAFEWTPEKYSLDDPWASYFTYVLVRAPAADADPAQRIFGSERSRVKTVAHRGRFWLFDIHGVFADDGPSLVPMSSPQTSAAPAR